MAKALINDIDISNIRKLFLNQNPFNHVVIDNFWKKDIAEQLQKEIVSFSSDNNNVSVYDSPLEKKITCNHYDKFSKFTYQAFTYLNSNAFIDIIKKITDIDDVIPDIGLSGGGLHIHPQGGKLNIHKDYSIHPKLQLERRINLIIYMTRDWQEDWGGHLELWSHNSLDNKPKKLGKRILNNFNRAVIFDTTQNSWHGLPDEIKAPLNINRQSMAVYFLTKPRKDISKRDRALFAPTKEQENDEKIMKLIKKRASSSTSDDAYRQK